MNELLQKHGCANVFTIPEGLKELMADITREVLRDQPPKLFSYIANYLSVLLITREHGILAVKILDDLCDCQPSVSEHLLELGMERKQAEMLSHIIKEEIEGFEPIEGKEKVRETQILKKILTRSVLDEDMSAKVCQVVRNAYKDYWYRKKLIHKNLNVHPEEPWEIAAQHTLELYKKTKPSLSELNRATEKIQAAYRGYHVRRNLLRHLKPKSKKSGPKVELPGPPLDVAGSREIDLGPVIDIKVKEDDMKQMFDDDKGQQLGLSYDTTKTITHVESARLPVCNKYQLPAKSHSVCGEIVAKKAQSKVSQAPSQVTSQMEGAGGARPSLISDVGMRKSRMAPDQSLQKIKFSEEPHEIIDIPEPPDVSQGDMIENLPFEAARSRSGVTAVTEDVEITDEITEDLTGEAESEAASAPSSGAVTANTTDAEDEDIAEASEGG